MLDRSPMIERMKAALANIQRRLGWVLSLDELERKLDESSIAKTR